MFRFLNNYHPENTRFFETIRIYLDRKGIKLILIWDQDDVYQKIEPTENSKLLSVSEDNTEAYEYFNSEKGLKILEKNEGFSKENSISFNSNFKSPK